MSAKPVSVSIDSFQSIDRLDFGISGFTTVTGPSNIGKSSIVRAISSAILNKSVVGSVRKGKKFCTVTMNGLKWEKGERVGRYWVPGEEKPRDSIGQGQTEVTELMGFRSVKVGDDYVHPWYASQFSPIFLMDKSGPSVTNFISDIAHLKSLQDAITLCMRRRQRLLSAVKEKEVEMESLLKKDEALSDLDALLAVEKDLIGQLDSIDEYGASIAWLQGLIDAVEADRASIGRLSPFEGLKTPRPMSEDAVRSIQGMCDLWSSIEAAAKRVSPIRGALAASVPEAMDVAGTDELSRMQDMLEIPDLRRSVSVLSNAASMGEPGKIVVPEDLVRGLRMAEEMAGAAVAVSALARDVPDVRAPGFSVAGLEEAAFLMLCLRADRESVASLEAELSKRDEELAAVVAELSLIPTCPTCDQVYVPAEHSHV